MITLEIRIPGRGKIVADIRKTGKNFFAASCSELPDHTGYGRTAELAIFQLQHNINAYHIGYTESLPPQQRQQYYLRMQSPDAENIPSILNRMKAKASEIISAFPPTIVHTENWQHGRRTFVVNVQQMGNNFAASCPRIPGIIGTGSSVKWAIDNFQENSDSFFAGYAAALPPHLRREVCLWMQDPDNPEYCPPRPRKSKAKTETKPSAFPPHRAAKKTSALGGRFSSAARPCGQQSHV